MFRPIPLLALTLLLCCPRPLLAADLMISAAASTTDVVKALTAAYGAAHPKVGFRCNFGASGTLAKQIAQGAPADLFISAHPKWMDYLVAEKLIAADRVRPFAGNSLVLVGTRGLAVSSLADVVKLRRIAIGSPQSVPAGQYAEQALKAAGVFDRLAGKLVMAQDVRQALVYADRGEVDGAFVYRTDAPLAKHSVILLEVPQSLYAEVTYPVGLTVEGAEKPDAVAFFDFLRTETALDILKKHQFVVR